ncbi:MAG TPA: adenylate/guanylate cyclase domain-containing protein [Solimonas sp.]|nr:adenylate/guanylate cyclase domain-containing protein [Solimonas sp.]
MLNCPSCGAQNPAAARFCNQCGQRIEAAPVPTPGYTPKHLAEAVLRNRAAMQGERKRVTVLFADVKGSTRLAQEAGPEAWHGILDRFFSILSAAVHRYEGTVNQYTGDGIMALFGAPIAHEDHASRACFAALEMQREVRRFADELRLKKGLNLSMRVGLNTGEVIVGRIGDDLRMDYTAQGATVNLAARMEHICEPGRVYLTRLTARQVEGYFRLRELGPMQVAGVDDPVEVYELESENSGRTRLELSLARAGSPFVGREPELGLLLQALERVRGGEGQIIAVIGNAGIGKSRLCHEFARACASAGLAVHRATGVPYRNAVPMHPIRQLARSRLGLAHDASSEEVRRLVAGTFLLHDPSLAPLLPPIFDFLGAGTGEVLAPDRAEQARQRLLDLLAEYLVCDDHDEPPQVLLLEDLHFFDPASEEFLARLCAQVRGTRTLLLLNYRPDYVSEALIPWLDEQIRVSALDDRQIEQLAGNLLGDDPSVAHLPKILCERAGGNPFFVEEAVLSLAESGDLVGERGAWCLEREISQWNVPDTVHALLAARIDRLPDGAKTLLQSAAVIGQEFRAPLLATLTDGREGFEDQLELLEEAGFVHQRDVSEYAFCHPLMQEVAYQAQLESRRAHAHGRLAAELQAQHPAQGEPTELSMRIAHHWQHAGEWAHAGRWNMQAARWAAARDMRTATEQFRLARVHLDLAGDSPEVQRLRIAARSGLIRLAQFAATAEDEVEQAYAEARKLAEDYADVATAAELMISYGNELLHRGDAEGSAAMHAEAVRLALSAGEVQLIHRFRLGVLLAHGSAGRPRDGIELCDAAGIDWRTRPIDSENFMSRAFYGLMMGWMGQLSLANENLLGAAAFAEYDDRSASWIYANLTDLAMLTGDYSHVAVAVGKAVARAAQSGSAFFEEVAARGQGLALCLQHRYAEAVEPLERTMALVRRGSFAHQFEAGHIATLATALIGAGRCEEGLAAAREAIASGQRSGSRIWEAQAWLALLRLPRDMEAEVRPAEALQRLRQLLLVTGAAGMEPWLMLAEAHWAADAALREGWGQRAAERFAELGATGHAERLRRGEVPLLHPAPA